MNDYPVGDERGLPHCCGLIAAAAYWYCHARGVPARVLNVRYAKDEGHTILVFQSSGGRLCTYDSDGSLIYTPATTWDIAPSKIARAWAKATGIKRKVTAGRWV